MGDKMKETQGYPPARTINECIVEIVSDSGEGARRPAKPSVSSVPAWAMGSEQIGNATGPRRGRADDSLNAGDEQDVGGSAF